MSGQTSSSRLVRWLGFTSVIGFVLAVYFLVKFVALGVKIAIVSGQVSMLIDHEEFARDESNPQKIVSVLVSAARKPEMHDESSLALIKETVRSNVVRNILMTLRQKSGMDYGDDPGEWTRHMKELPTSSKP